MRRLTLKGNEERALRDLKEELSRRFNVMTCESLAQRFEEKIPLNLT